MQWHAAKYTTHTPKDGTKTNNHDAAIPAHRTHGARPPSATLSQFGQLARKHKTNRRDTTAITRKQQHRQTKPTAQTETTNSTGTAHSPRELATQKQGTNNQSTSQYITTTARYITHETQTSNTQQRKTPQTHTTTYDQRAQVRTYKSSTTGHTNIFCLHANYHMITNN